MYQEETSAFIPHRGSSLPRLSGCLWKKTIHPHTCICNEIISLPPRAAISQPPVPGWARSHTHGMQKRKSWGEVRSRYSRAAGQTGKYTVPEREEDEKRSQKGNRRCRERRGEIKRSPRNILSLAMNRGLPRPARSSLMWWSKHPDTASVPISNVGMPNCIPPFTSWHVGRKVTSQSHNTNTLSSLLRAV